MQLQTPQIHDINTVWEPLPGSQELALDSRCHHTLVCGTRGPGKTDVQLMRFRKRVGQGYGAFWRGVIFDREYKNLDDLVNKSKRWFLQFNDGAKFLESAKDYKWVWPTGEELLFRTAKADEDYWDFHGQEFPFIGWNELTKYPTGKLYQDMQSCNRSSFTPEKDTPKKISPTGKFLGYDTPDGKLLPEIPLEVFSTTNPFGPGHAWVKRKFIDVAPYGVVVSKATKVYNPRTGQSDFEVNKTQVAIFGSYRENKYLSPEYVADLERITDPQKRRAWLGGDWNIVAGGAFDDVWNSEVHVVPRFKVPSSWPVDRAFDWGSTHPFSVGWWAEANGEEVILPNGEKFAPVAGSLIQVHEWYGTEDIGTNTGLKMSAPDIARGVLEREKYLLDGGWIAERPEPGPADNQIANVRERDVDTIKKKMEDLDVIWTDSDKTQGSRSNGFQLFRDRLAAAVTGDGVGIYFMDHCRASLALLPTLPRDDKKLDDVDTDAEDHTWDMTRYRVLKGNNRLATKIEVHYPS